MECDRSLSPSQSFLSPSCLARPAHGQSSPATVPTSSRARISPSPRHPAHRDPDYARTVNSYPHKHEKEAILASLHAIPGNEKYTLHSLAAWFSRHRNPSPVLLNDETIRESPPPHTCPTHPSAVFPKLTPVHLQQLRVLYRKNPNPSEGIVTFWAGRISAERAEIAAWIQYQQEKEKETPESPDIPLRDLVSASPTAFEFPRTHLPTPAESLSPQTRMPSLPPIAVKVEDFRCLSPVSSFAAPLFKPRSATDLPPSLSRLQTTVRRFTTFRRLCSQRDRQPRQFPAPCYASAGSET